MANGFKRVHEDKTRGVDHGTWVPLMFMYPEADIPVCQLSVQTDRDGTYHYNLGKALAPLREEGILIMGSGATTHNLGTMQPSGSPVPSWALQFDTWLKNALLEGRYVFSLEKSYACNILDTCKSGHHIYSSCN
uniref:Extradiol ring-cleavage dioxygenase class III enzyme subunit B domain-containing protein n=2 Tax=Populus TaxID=3689 RepID=A0A4U5QW96_POPAL|nr:hypothetical protein D5086_0000048520 [Populus alba]